MSRRYSISPSLITSGRRDSTISNPTSSLSEEERLRRRSESSVKYVPGAITTVLYDTTFGALVEQANREREEYIARLDAVKDEPSLSAITEEEGSDPLPNELLEKYRRHFLKATRHLQQELPNSYVLLTGIGYVPSVISMVQYLEPDSYYFERGQGRTYLYLVLSAISFYIITYALLYYIMFPLFAASMTGSNMAPLKDVIDPDHDPPSIWATLDYNFIRRVVDAPPGLHYMPSILGFYRVMYIVYDIASGIFSFIMLTAIILSEKNENYYTGGGIEQFVFTVWIFIINTLMFMVHIYAMIKADTELRKQWHLRNKERMESSQNSAELGATGQFLERERQCQTPPPVLRQL